MNDSRRNRMNGFQTIPPEGVKLPANGGKLAGIIITILVVIIVLFNSAYQIREQEQAVAAVRRRIEQRATGGRDQQAGDGAVLVTEAANQRAGRQRHDNIGAEEAQLHQHRLHVGEGINRFQVRDQDVVE